MKTATPLLQILNCNASVEYIVFYLNMYLMSAVI